MRIYCFISFICLLLLSACEETIDSSGGSGGFAISLTEALADVHAVKTKSVPSELDTPLQEQFHLQITDISSGLPAYEGSCATTLIKVSPGTYDLTATYGNDVILAFDAPLYKGELTDQTVGTTVKNINIECAVANALASVKYVNKSVFDALFSSYGIEVTSGETILNWGSIQDGKSVYFKAGSQVSFVFKGILKASNRELIFPVDQEQGEGVFGAGDHYIMNLTFSGGDANLNIKTKVEKITINETVPQAWLPKPATGSDDFLNRTLTVVETTQPEAKIKLLVASGLQDLKLTVDLEDRQFVSLNKTYILSELSDIDKQALEEAGIILPETGSVSPVVDLAILASKLQTLDDGTAVENRFRINVKANDRWSCEEGKEDVYVLTTQRPMFDLVVYPGDIWTKEFTATPVISTGDEENLNKAFVYEYSIDQGTTWMETSQRNTVTGLNPGDAYKVRVKYRAMVSEERDVVAGVPTQVPNSGMEDWYYVTDTKKWLWNTYYWYTYYPFNTDEPNIWWATNNLRTTDWPRAGGVSFPVSYASTSAVSFITGDAHEGNRCAEIRSMGSGSQFANTADICYDGSKIAGQLFIGDYGWVDKTETVRYGRPFASRPTDFSFWYKYTPSGTDEFSVYVEFQNRDSETTMLGSATVRISKSEADNDWIQVKEKINYTDKFLPVTHMYVKFISSTAEIPPINTNVSMKLEGVNDNWKAHVGSRLRIDDLSFVYDK